MAHRIAQSRLAALFAATALAAVSLTACVPATSPTPVPTSSESEQGMTFPEVRTALMAADPRVVDTGVLESQSGAARVLTVGAVVSADDATPISTASLTAMLVAVRDSLPSDVDQLDFLVRDDSDKSRIIDLGPAIAGLPAGVTALYDGTLTLTRADLDKL
ncbi:hypothetical protein [Microbacterium sp. F2E]|uniref:hypothetical protein n=1 Tax=Microbacterium sp. F2E TaxID=2895284 RepID=UPI001E62525C|nr:hypothetical protein [Microbacterium sp. F2E]